MTESFLHYLWQHKQLQGDLKTTAGIPIEIERVGEYNRNAGPDFLDCRIRIGGILWAGNVEIHVKASDWNLHAHTGDPNYDTVILHVVYDYDTDIYNSEGKPIPTLDIHEAYPETLWTGYAALMQPQLPIEIPCMLQLQEVPNLILNSYIDRLCIERIERKADDVRRLLDDSNNHWESCCYWMIARYFGGKVNAYAFEMLAKATPLRILAKIKDKPMRVEALFMGQAGFLEGEFKDAYPLQLQKEYQYLRVAYQLTPMASHLWKFFRMRPSNFPTIRISQLAQLIASSTNLFSKLLETPEVNDLRKLFDIQTSDYWHNHYRFDVESEPIGKSAGKSFVDILLINSWVPVLFEYGVQHGSQQYKDQAIAILQQLPSENNRIVRLWSQAGVVAKDASRSQGELQLYNEYCKNKRCLDCAVAYQLLIKKNRRKDHVANTDPTQSNTPAI